MKLTTIYQTLENRNNKTEVESHGPYFCDVKYPNGQLKKGRKEPWLGPGYYFWDTRIADAHWWGKTVYQSIGKGYYVCETQYDAHTEKLFDMVGDLSAFDRFVSYAECIKANQEKKGMKDKKVSFPYVLQILKKLPDFKNYSAIRVRPIPKRESGSFIHFPGKDIYLGVNDKVQICFFDKSLLNNTFTVLEVRESLYSTTI